MYPSGTGMARFFFDSKFGLVSFEKDKLSDKEGLETVSTVVSGQSQRLTIKRLRD